MNEVDAVKELWERQKDKETKVRDRGGWAVYVAAWGGGMADVGYFLFMDLGGHVKFVPGTVMTIVSATAIVLSFVALRRAEEPAAAPQPG